MILQRIAITAAMATALTACGAGAGTDPVESGKPGQVQKKSTAKTAKVGSAVKDGKFTFTVTKTAPGPKRIGDQYAGKNPQGKFFYVHVTVANHGDKAQYFSGDSQKLLAGGKEYSADTEAAIYLSESSQSLFEEINPGNSVKGIIVYDIPKNVSPTGIELHDSPFSGGVKVTLN